MGKKKLLVVESPTKAKTLSEYLGDDFQILASLGHIKDLPKTRLGVDIEHGFKTTYQLLPKKRKTVKEICESAQEVACVYLGSDPDREGEAIAYHVAEEINKVAHPEIKRILLYEITKEELEKALENPGELDMNKVYAQQARRVLDRLVGYQVSPILWKTVRRGLSAGRVQTVAVRLIVERDREIKSFQPQKYWSIEGIGGKNGKKFKIELVAEGEKSLSRIPDLEVAQKILQELKGVPLTVTLYKQEERLTNPPPPLKTSTLQQEASNRFNFFAERTMRIAQELYEGIDLPIGSRGLITYMRTDSVRIAETPLTSLRNQIKTMLGENYLSKTIRRFKEKPGVQGAHEAIRPTDIRITPESVNDHLTREQFKLYELIWNRALASQMESAHFEMTRAELKAQDYIFVSEGKILTFDGFYKILGNPPRDITLPSLNVGETLIPLELTLEEHQTEPPKPYTEATLIKTLEAKGIGRPSTYAPTLKTIFARHYIKRNARYLEPTELGVLVCDLLLPRFKELFAVGFTRKMEDELDRVEEGSFNWDELLKEFYTHFSKELAKATGEIKEIKQELVETTTENCPLCHKPLLIRWGRFGRFLACSGFPECKYTRPLELEIHPTEKCSKCGKSMSIRSGKGGRFLACIDYPKCEGTKPFLIGVTCPECGGELLERKSKKNRVFYACSNYPDCKFTIANKPINAICSACGYKILTESKRFKCLQCPKCKKTFPK